MKEMSSVGKEMLAFQAQLAAERGYKPVEIDLFVGDVREKYRNALPEWCIETGDAHAALYSLDGTLLCEGYKRIVIPYLKYGERKQRDSRCGARDGNNFMRGE